MRLEPEAAHLGYNRPPITALIGEPGTGKTTLLRAIAEQLYTAGRPLLCVTVWPERLLSDEVLATLEVPDGTPAPRQIALRDLPGASEDPSEYDAAQRAALATARQQIDDALAGLSAGAVVLVEEAWVLTRMGLNGAALLRQHHGERRSLVVSVQYADDLADCPPADITRFLLFGTDNPVAAADALRLAGLQPNARNIDQLRTLARVSNGGARGMLLCDLDGRAVPIATLDAQGSA